MDLHLHLFLAVISDLPLFNEWYVCRTNIIEEEKTKKYSVCHRTFSRLFVKNYLQAVKQPQWLFEHGRKRFLHYTYMKR